MDLENSLKTKHTHAKANTENPALNLNQPNKQK